MAGSLKTTTVAMQQPASLSVSLKLIILNVIMVNNLHFREVCNKLVCMAIKECHDCTHNAQRLS